MKFKIILFLAIFLFAFQAVNGQNILINPSFEIWLDTLGINLPLGWVTSELTFPGSATKTTDAHTGNFAIKLAGGDTLAFAATTSMVVAGNRYDFSGWSKCPSILGGSFVIAWLTVLGQPVGTPTIIPIVLSNSYRNYTARVTAPDSAVLVVVTVAALVQATVYADDVTLDTVAAGIDEVSKSDVKANQIVIQPNPFSQSTIIRMPYPMPSASELSIYDIKGRLVKSFSTNHQSLTTNHCLVWDGTDDKGLQLSPGVYFVQFLLNSRTCTHQIMLLSK